MSRSYATDAGELTPRMRQVVACAASGQTVGQTALALGISPATVRTIRAATIARTESPNWLCAVLSARERGLA